MKPTMMAKNGNNYIKNKSNKIIVDRTPALTPPPSSSMQQHVSREHNQKKGENDVKKRPQHRLPPSLHPQYPARSCSSSFLVGVVNNSSTVQERSTAKVETQKRPPRPRPPPPRQRRQRRSHLEFRRRQLQKGNKHKGLPPLPSLRHYHSSSSSAVASSCKNSRKDESSPLPLPLELRIQERDDDAQRELPPLSLQSCPLEDSAVKVVVQEQKEKLSPLLPNLDLAQSSNNYNQQKDLTVKSSSSSLVSLLLPSQDKDKHNGDDCSVETTDSTVSSISTCTFLRHLPSQEQQDQYHQYRNQFTSSLRFEDTCYYDVLGGLSLSPLTLFWEEEEEEEEEIVFIHDDDDNEQDESYNINFELFSFDLYQQQQHNPLCSSRNKKNIFLPTLMNPLATSTTRGGTNTTTTTITPLMNRETKNNKLRKVKKSRRVTAHKQGTSQSTCFGGGGGSGSTHSKANTAVPKNSRRSSVRSGSSSKKNSRRSSTKTLVQELRQDNPYPKPPRQQQHHHQQQQSSTLTLEKQPQEKSTTATTKSVPFRSMEIMLEDSAVSSLDSLIDWTFNLFTGANSRTNTTGNNNLVAAAAEVSEPDEPHGLLSCYDSKCSSQEANAAATTTATATTSSDELPGHSHEYRTYKSMLLSHDADTTVDGGDSDEDKSLGGLTFDTATQTLVLPHQQTHQPQDYNTDEEDMTVVLPLTLVGCGRPACTATVDDDEHKLLDSDDDFSFHGPSRPQQDIKKSKSNDKGTDHTYLDNDDCSYDTDEDPFDRILAKQSKEDEERRSCQHEEKPKQDMTPIHPIHHGDNSSEGEHQAVDVNNKDTTNNSDATEHEPQNEKEVSPSVQDKDQESLSQEDDHSLEQEVKRPSPPRRQRIDVTAALLKCKKEDKELCMQDDEDEESFAVRRITSVLSQTSANSSRAKDRTRLQRAFNFANLIKENLEKVEEEKATSRSCPIKMVTVRTMPSLPPLPPPRSNSDISKNTRNFKRCVSSSSPSGSAPMATKKLPSLLDAREDENELHGLPSFDSLDSEDSLEIVTSNPFVCNATNPLRSNSGNSRSDPFPEPPRPLTPLGLRGQDDDGADFDKLKLKEAGAQMSKIEAYTGNEDNENAVMAKRNGWNFLTCTAPPDLLAE